MHPDKVQQMIDAIEQWSERDHTLDDMPSSSGAAHLWHFSNPNDQAVICLRGEVLVAVARACASGGLSAAGMQEKLDFLTMAGFIDNTERCVPTSHCYCALRVCRLHDLLLTARQEQSMLLA